jgi:hypothetical protein
MTDAELLGIIARADREVWTELDLLGKKYLADRATKKLVK